MRRVILTTGGTGGHIFPALAAAEELRVRFPEARILFVGGAKGPEGRYAAGAGLEFESLPARGVLGKGVGALSGIAALAVSIVLAFGLIGRFKPEVVLGFGGYAGFAGVLAAALRGVPTAIHEQNSVPGLANRLLGRLTRRVLVSFPDTSGAFDPDKTVLTGNPVRRSIADLAKAGQQSAPGKRVLVLGGSQGAKAVNTAIIETLPRLAEAGVILRHQAGTLDLERTRAGYRDAGFDPQCVVPFIEDMAEAYAWADLAVCRAGATTVAELAVAGMPAVFIPFPFATHDHQSINAGFLQEAGAAVRVEQKDLDTVDLAGLILGLLADRDRLAAMAAAARSWGRPEAAAAVVEQLEILTRPRQA